MTNATCETKRANLDHGAASQRARIKIYFCAAPSAEPVTLDSSKNLIVEAIIELLSNRPDLGNAVAALLARADQIEAERDKHLDRANQAEAERDMYLAYIRGEC